MRSLQLLGVQECHDVSDQGGEFISRGRRLRRWETAPCQRVHMEAVAKAYSQVVESYRGCAEASQKHDRRALAAPVQIVQSDSVRLDEVFREQTTGFCLAGNA